VVAVTGAEAEAAIADGEALAARLADAEGLAGPALDAAVTSLKQARGFCLGSLERRSSVVGRLAVL